MLIVALSAALAFAQASTPAATPVTQGSPAPAAQAAAPPPAAAKPEKPKKPKLICTEEGQIGSLMTKRVCRTPEKVEADRRTVESQLGNCQGQGC
jgi:hypothetical protein